jgi:putative membrane protein
MMWGGIAWIVFWVVAAGALVWLVAIAVRRRGPREAVGPRGETPLDILKARYARGDIDREEYETRRRDLS